MEEFMKNYHPGDTIDLGWENGWNDSKYDLLKELNQYEMKGTHSRTGSASNQTISFKIMYNGHEYKVVYHLDSGD